MQREQRTALARAMLVLHDASEGLNTLSEECEDPCDIDFLRSIQKQMADTADQIELICNDF